MEDKRIKAQMGNMTLFQIFELISKHKRNTRLNIQLGNEIGNFYFKEGRLVHGENTSIYGKETCYELSAWQGGVIELTKDIPSPKSSVDISWEEVKFRYVYELKKVIDVFVNDVSHLLSFEIFNNRKEIVYSFNREPKFETLISEIELKKMFDEVLRHKEKELLLTYQKYRVIVKYIEEINYFLKLIFIEKSNIDLPRHWLNAELQYKILDAFSKSLRKSDKLNKDEFKEDIDIIKKGLLRKKIIFVSKETYLKNLIFLKFTAIGYEVILSEEPIKAIELIKITKPDLIIFDIDIPEIDGINGLKIIQNDLRILKLPVIIMTNLESVSQKESTLSDINCIIKPFSPQKLIKMVINIVAP